MVNFNKDNKPNALETMRTCAGCNPFKNSKNSNRGESTAAPWTTVDIILTISTGLYFWHFWAIEIMSLKSH